MSIFLYVCQLSDFRLCKIGVSRDTTFQEHVITEWFKPIPITASVFRQYKIDHAGAEAILSRVSQELRYSTWNGLPDYFEIYPFGACVEIESESID